MGKPPFLFGRMLFGQLPLNTVGEAANLNALISEIVVSPEGRSCERDVIIRCSSTLISLSTSADLYAGVLNEDERYNEDKAGAAEDGHECLAQMARARRGPCR